MVDYDSVYLEQADYFGTELSPLLERFAASIPEGSRILDLGIGQGRNALPLARRGFRLTGVDTSQVALDTVRQRADKEMLPFSLWCGSFMKYDPEETTFGAVLAFGLLQMLGRHEGASLLFRLREWIQPGGLLFLTAWHVDDPAYPRISDEWERIGLHSFRGPDGEIRTFLARGEILDLMLGWRVVHHWEGTGPVHQHGDGPPEQHGDVQAVLVRPI